MHVPEPVISLAVTPVKKDQMPVFNKALTRFQKEDPTFRVKTVLGFFPLKIINFKKRIKLDYM